MFFFLLTDVCLGNIFFGNFKGIEGAFSGVGAKTVIPGKVIGKFSIRLVPNMDPAEVDRIVIAHLDKLWKERGSPNHYRFGKTLNCLVIYWEISLVRFEKCCFTPSLNPTNFLRFFSPK